jgi:hypothetical protein
MSVEATAPITADQNNAAPADTSSMDDAMGAVWDRMERDNGAARGEGGKFSSTSASEPSPAQEGESQASQEPLEGGGGEEATEGEISTPPEGVPLPSNWRGQEELWAKIPEDLRGPIAEREAKIHQTLSQQGQQLAGYKPIGEAINKFSEYFNGERGSYKPAEAVEYLFNVQRQMDDNPVSTILDIAKRYDILPQLAKVFTPQEGDEGQQPSGQNETAALLAEIGELKRTIGQISDPARVDERITAKLSEDRAHTQISEVISRVSKDMPLYGEVEQDLPGYIQKSWEKLGDTASPDAVLKRAYDMAINADPDLRKKAAALASAATADPQRVADAKRANESNIRSTSTGRPREATEDELLGAVFDKHKRG